MEHTDPPPATQREARAWIVAAAVALAIGSALGAYGDWMLWPVYSGFVLALGAFALSFIASLMVLVTRGTARRVGLVALAFGTGLVLGQNLGPTREPLLDPTEGTMIVRLESPVEATSTGSASCTNVASETEFAVEGSVNLRLPDANRVVHSVYVSAGDRWVALSGSPRRDGVLLQVHSSLYRIPADGDPSVAGMVATDASTVASTFSNRGGSVRFAGLQPLDLGSRPAEPLDLAGVIEWDCGPVASDPEA
jgi:hypothetical protein